MQQLRAGLPGGACGLVAPQRERGGAGGGRGAGQGGSRRDTGLLRVCARRSGRAGVQAALSTCLPA